MAKREANVLLELRLADHMSEEVLEQTSGDVIEAVVEHAADIALGPALAVNAHTQSIKLRFDVLARNDAEIYERVSAVLGIIVRETSLELVVSRSSVEIQVDADASRGDLAAA